MAFLFKELLLISIGKRECFSVDVSADDLVFLYNEARKQALVGVLFTGIEQAFGDKKCSETEKKIIFQWFASCRALEEQNVIQRQQIEELSLYFNKSDIRNTLLKGQGYASLYPHPVRRQCGDIDLWVDAKRDDIVRFCKERWGIDHIDYKHLAFKKSGTHVEVHFIPSWFYNPFVNRKFRMWYRKSLGEQFQLFPTNGFPTPTIDFNLVYCCVHIYKHIFDEGIGLRQLMDYYYILQHSSSEQRKQAYEVLCGLKMKKFVGAVMYVLKYFFEIDDSMMLCEKNESRGKKLLQDILDGGNFGHHNVKNRHGKEKRITRGIRNIRHNSAILCDYPSEVLWSPFWKIWHLFWRKSKGYL